jgi:hypothetical protein
MLTKISMRVFALQRTTVCQTLEITLCLVENRSSQTVKICEKRNTGIQNPKSFVRGKKGDKQREETSSYNELEGVGGGRADTVGAGELWFALQAPLPGAAVSAPRALVAYLNSNQTQRLSFNSHEELMD